MRSTPQPSDHRRNRLTAWLRLWLVWLVGFYVSCWAHDERARRRELDRVAQRVGLLVFIHAAARLRRRPRRGRPFHRKAKREYYRAWIGSALRPAMRGKSWQARLIAILAVMRDLESHIVRMVRRLRRGMNSHAALVLTRAPAATLRFMSPRVLCADSS